MADILRCSLMFSLVADICDTQKNRILYSIYATPQRLPPSTLDTNNITSIGVQYFTVLWEQPRKDVRIYQAIEAAIAEDVLAPVLIIHYTKGQLTLVIDEKISIIDFSSFINIWIAIASDAEPWDEWTLRCIKSADLSIPFLEGRILREYGSIILNSIPNGIHTYSPESFFLFYDEWCRDPDSYCTDTDGEKGEVPPSLFDDEPF
ncbi:hypothetical protein [Pseudomonas putida]|uniref:hypothetical protein n=1 Tax=Pseudomonas putida TaxID=303 RepID=UPI0027451617|nr:hypothetical protein [Pseudomonas putida]MDP9523606.1 hypothetical protein [Pseudomonas putida]